AGGTPTFPIHARRADLECSPGTCVFWDASSASKLPDLSFLPAALVLTRVISKPAPDRLCLDLGHKALASEMPHPRVQFLNLPDKTPRPEPARTARAHPAPPLHTPPALHQVPHLAGRGGMGARRDSAANHRPRRWCLPARPLLLRPPPTNNGKA